MSEMDKAAFVVSQSAAAVIEALGMFAEDARAEAMGAPRKHRAAHYQALIERYQIGHNAVINYLDHV